MMVKVREDLTGQTFNDLTVIEQAEDHISIGGHHYAQWRCKCACGNENFVVQQSHLKSGHTKSCGHNQHKQNIFDLSGEYGVGWTTNTNREFYFDLEDYDKIKNYSWYEHNPACDYKSLLAYDKETKNKIKFWWVVFGKGCDHINHNTFDNRKSNLRECTFRENRFNSGINSRNTSSVIGVYLHKSSNKWVAYLNKDGERVYTSSLCDNKDDAIKLRLMAEQRFYGQFAPQQYLYEQYGIEVNNYAG